LPHEDEAPLRRSLLRLDALFSSVILENDVDSLDDFLARIGFAIDYDLVLQRFGTANLHYVFLGKTIVPTAIPSGPNNPHLPETYSPIERKSAFEHPDNHQDLRTS
jgi:hypothetical protein